MLSAFVVAVGLDNGLKLLLFLVAAGFVLFSLAVFNFIPQVAVLLFLSCGLAVTEWRFAFSQKRFFKLYLVFTALTFFVAVFGGQNYIVGKQKLLCRQAVTVFFLPAVFSFVNSIRPLMQAVCVLLVTIF